MFDNPTADFLIFLVLESIKSERKYPKSSQGNLRCEDRGRGYHPLQFYGWRGLTCTDSLKR